MAGTQAGGKNAATTNKERYGEDYYARIGRIGGKKGTTGGFAYAIECDCDLVEPNPFQTTHFVRQCAGKKGGMTSRRGKSAKRIDVVMYA